MDTLTETPVVGINAFCYQGIQRVFRNSLVSFIRERMGAAFPADHIEKLKRPFAKEWDMLVSNSSASRKNGGTSTEIRDEYDLLSVGHFFSVFEAYFDKLFASSAAWVGPGPNRIRLLGNLKAIKDCRDPLSHPAEEEISFQEAYAILTDAHQVLSVLNLDEAATNISTLLDHMTESGGHEPAVRTVIPAIPPQESICMEFVGRTAILEDLRLWFGDSNNRSALLAGDGGKGKSAIAYRYALEVIRQPKEVQLVLWMSAKRRKFQAGSVVDISEPDFTDLDSALMVLLKEYGGLASEFERPLIERKRQVIDLLDSYPAFIVVDDLDSRLEDSSLVGFFTGEVPYKTRSRVLLTSRKDIPGTRLFTVKGFEQKEGEAFVQSRIKLLDLDSKAYSSDRLKEMLQTTDGSPLFMEDLMRLTKVLSVERAIAAWRDKKGDDARRYALQREMEHLSDGARSVLIAAAISSGAISFAELETVTGQSEDRLLSSLAELQTLFLFPKPKVVEGEQRFDVNSNTRKLVVLVESGSDRYRRIEAKHKALSGQLPEVGRGIVSSLIRQAFLLVNSGRHIEAETLLLAAREKYMNVGDLHGFIGFLYRRWSPPRIADARDAFEMAYKLRCKNVETYRQWIRMESDAKEWSRAVAAADKGIQHLPEAYELRYSRAVAKTMLGRDFEARRMNEKAVKLWDETCQDLRAMLRSPNFRALGDRSLKAGAHRSLIICLGLLGDLNELNSAFATWQCEHPDDPHVVSEHGWMRRKFGSAFLVELNNDTGTTVQWN